MSDNNEDTVVVESPTKPITTPKRTAPAAKDDTKKAKKPKITGTGKGDDNKKSKAGAGTPKKGFPQSAEELNETDRLIINMKKAGKPWPEIDDEIEKVTGVRPGKDVTRKRHPKLVAVSIGFSADAEKKLVEIKKKVEGEVAQQIKALQTQMWATIAAELNTALEDGQYNRDAVERRFATMLATGKLNANGDYITGKADADVGSAEQVEV